MGEQEMKKWKDLAIVISVSVVLATVAVLSIVLAPEFADEGYRTEAVVALSICPLWAFSVAPTYAAGYHWLKDKSFGFGAWFGLVFGLFLPLLIAPVFMVFYFVDSIENIIKKR